ncbi:MAG: hypothetical protein JNM78_08955 [Cyclobacteriaceae bacterium]|nr:hypothetical protein [Cyclobacteriaceae bacterium]
MPSLIKGYEYDIFISYRHNDNRSGWVTEFVSALSHQLNFTHFARPHMQAHIHSQSKSVLRVV